MTSSTVFKNISYVPITIIFDLCTRNVNKFYISNELFLAKPCIHNHDKFCNVLVSKWNKYKASEISVVYYGMVTR